MAIAPPGPMTATSTPATAGPTIQPKLSLMPISAFACCSWDGGTICGRMAPAAGRKNASAAPWKAASTASCQICAVPVSSNTAAVICTAARTRSLVIMRAARGSLSAHTPPTSASRTSGMLWAASTSPRSVPEPVRSSTANVSATGVMPSPNTETLCARNTLRKSRRRSAPAPSRRRAGMKRERRMHRVYKGEGRDDARP